MTLKEFLATNSISQVEFASRCSIPQTTIAAIVTGGGCRAVTALKIIAASGGMITLKDLAGEASHIGEQGPTGV